MRVGHLMRMLDPDLLDLEYLSSYGYFHVPKGAANEVLKQHRNETPVFFNVRIVGAKNSKRCRQFENMDRGSHPHREIRFGPSWHDRGVLEQRSGARG